MTSVIKRVLLALLLVSLPVAALADGGSQLTTTGGTVYTNFLGGATLGQLIKPNGASRLYKIINASTTAQTATFTCYDSNVGAQGVILWSGVLGASAVVDIQIQANTGIYCQPSAALNAATATSGGVNVLAN